MLEHSLRTDRLHLRPVGAGDVDAVATYCADLALARWMTHIPHPYHCKDAEEYVARASVKPGRVWAITLNDALVGTVGTVREFGYWVGRPYWRKGIAAEACMAVLAHYFTDPAHADIAARHALGNAASAALLRKLGFVDVGPTTITSQATNETTEAREVLLTKDDWSTLQNA